MSGAFVTARWVVYDKSDAIKLVPSSSPSPRPDLTRQLFRIKSESDLGFRKCLDPRLYTAKFQNSIPTLGRQAVPYLFTVNLTSIYLFCDSSSCFQS